MPGPTFRITEIVGTDSGSVDAAIRSGVARAGKTLRNVDWFQVEEIRGYVRQGEVEQFQVTLKVGFKLED